MSSHREPPRLRKMGAALPEGLAAALESDPAEFPEAAQLSDLTNRLAPLLGTAAATAIPVGLLAPKAPLSLTGMLKLLALKWGHTVILPMAIGAASGGIVWEAREYAVSHDDPSRVAQVAETQRAGAASQGQHSKREFVVSNDDVDVVHEPTAADVEPATPPARAGSALGSARVAYPPPSAGLGDLPVVAVAEDVTEIELIDRAQRALLRQPAVARQWLDEHMRRFPDGTFVQERETVAIEALVGEGHLVEARARAFQFRTRFPQSAYLRRIDAVLRSPKTP